MILERDPSSVLLVAACKAEKGEILDDRNGYHFHPLSLDPRRFKNEKCVSRTPESTSSSQTSCIVACDRGRNDMSATRKRKYVQEFSTSNRAVSLKIIVLARAFAFANFWKTTPITVASSIKPTTVCTTMRIAASQHSPKFGSGTPLRSMGWLGRPFTYLSASPNSRIWHREFQGNLIPVLLTENDLPEVSPCCLSPMEVRLEASGIWQWGARTKK